MRFSVLFFLFLYLIYLFVSCISFLIDEYKTYKSIKNNLDVLLTFKNFKIYYYLNEEGYKLRSDYPYREIHQNGKCKYMIIAFPTFGEYILYRRFYKKVKTNEENDKKNRKQVEKTKEFLEAVQNDIDDIKEIRIHNGGFQC